jgi:hypothetical protein
MIIYVVECETTNFSFRAADTNRDCAEAAMRSGLLKHAKTYGLPREWAMKQDFNVLALWRGQAYCDGSPLLTA